MTGPMHGWLVQIGFNIPSIDGTSIKTFGFELLKLNSRCHGPCGTVGGWGGANEVYIVL